MDRIFVPSEIDQLRTVIVHRPDEGIARISPRRSDELLFDDIVYLPKMRQEHDTFVQVLKCFLGPDHVLEVEDLIFESLEASPEGREEIIELISEFEELPSSFTAALNKLENRKLSKVLIRGFIHKEDFILFDPIPNFIFTRDVAVVVNDHVIVTKAAKEARHRENLLARFVFWYHPIFQHLKEEKKVINLNHIDEFPPSRRGEQVSIEGGDMMILNSEYFLIGCSERSTTQAFHSLKQVLFDKGVIDNVVMVKIPADRQFMHIDTIFTQINTNHVIAYQPIVMEGLSSYVEVFHRKGTKRVYSSIQEFIIREVNPDMKFIPGGGGISPYQEREQWTDCCNLVAIRPGIAITYDRNPYTEIEFEKEGYQILRAEDFLKRCTKDPAFAKNLGNTIITLPSAELSRARGGSHCMTCPIIRG